MLILGNHNIDEVKYLDINEFQYAPVMPDDVWKVDMVKELMELISLKFKHMFTLIVTQFSRITSLKTCKIL